MSQLFRMSNYTQLNQQKLLLLTDTKDLQLIGRRLARWGPASYWDVSRLVPFPSPPCHRVLLHCCSPGTTTLSQRLVPAAGLPKPALQKTTGNGEAPLASVVELFAFIFFFPQMSNTGADAPG